jgi:hypothetical protein
MARYIFRVSPFLFMRFLFLFTKDLESGKDTEIQRLANVGRMSHKSEKNNSVESCRGYGARSNVTDIPVDQKDKWSIAVSFDAQLIVFWNKMPLQPIDEQNFGHKCFLSISHHVIMTAK